MELWQALRCKPGIQIAAVGAGGKSTLLFELARQIPGKAIVTTTTHLSIDQTQWGDVLLYDNDPHITEKIRSCDNNSVIVIVSSNMHGERASGPSELVLRQIHELCRQESISLLIEADGSKRLPLKAPAEHEPVIPPWVDLVLYIVGCSAIGKQLNDQNVFRPEQFSKLSGLALNQNIDASAITAMLDNPLGGLKGIPAQSRAIVIFTQTDQLDALSVQTVKNSISGILRKYSSVGLLAMDSMENKWNHKFEMHEQTAGVILAAGESSRFGQSKQLLQYKGHSFLRHTILRALEAGLWPVICVLGSKMESMKPELDGLQVTILENPNWMQGQSTSVREAVSYLQENTTVGGAMFFTVDQPLLTVKTIKSIIDTHNQNIGRTIVPAAGGKPGSPVLFDADHMTLMLSIVGDKGGRAILNQVDHKTLEIDDPDELMDVDTPEQYRRIQLMLD